MCFLYFVLILAKEIPNMVFSLFSPYSNQNYTKNGIFRYFCSNPNQSFATNCVSLYFWPYFNQSLTKKGVFFYFCSNPNQNYATKGVFL